MYIAAHDTHVTANHPRCPVGHGPIEPHGTTCIECGREGVDPAIARIARRLDRDLMAGRVVATKRGSEIAARLARYLDTTGADPADRTIDRLCSLLTRLAPAYERIQEGWCSDERACNHEPTRRRIERREARIEARARAIVSLLPLTVTGERITIAFSGDPRGYTMRLIVPDGTRSPIEIGISPRAGL